MTVILIVIRALGINPKRSVKRLENSEIRASTETFQTRVSAGPQISQSSSIIKIDLNTEKNPRQKRRLAVTQTAVKDHQQVLE